MQKTIAVSLVKTIRIGDTWQVYIVQENGTKLPNDKWVVVSIGDKSIVLVAENNDMILVRLP